MRYLILCLVACMAHLCANEVGREMGIVLPIEGFEFNGKIQTKTGWEGSFYNHPDNYTRRFYLLEKRYEEEVNPVAFTEEIRKVVHVTGAEVKDQTLFYSGKCGQIPMISEILEFDFLNVFQLYIIDGKRVITLSATVCKCDVKAMAYWKTQLQVLPEQIYFERS